MATSSTNSSNVVHSRCLSPLKANLSPRVPPHKELEFVEKCATAGTGSWYLVDTDWLKRWSLYAKQNGPRPGPITNLRLLQKGGMDSYKPKANLQPAKDYRGLRREAWIFLWNIHGGGPEIRSDYVDIYWANLEIDRPDKAEEDVETASIGTGSGCSQGASSSTSASQGTWSTRMFNMVKHSRHLKHKASSNEAERSAAVESWALGHEVSEEHSRGRSSSPSHVQEWPEGYRIKAANYRQECIQGSICPSGAMSTSAQKPMQPYKLSVTPPSGVHSHHPSSENCRNEPCTRSPRTVLV
mmetsp:Transcript_36668/g.67224  ORF Transcript_36668/g.67224 Transcript_36668/m.67224 type:complete len:298 (+) Transcript_36668:58-951(+)